jgi:hypothetical protein
LQKRNSPFPTAKLSNWMKTTMETVFMEDPTATVTCYGILLHNSRMLNFKLQLMAPQRKDLASKFRECLMMEKRASLVWSQSKLASTSRKTMSFT